MGRRSAIARTEVKPGTAPKKAPIIKPIIAYIPTEGLKNVINP
jgi:hypothetical protein